MPTIINADTSTGGAIITGDGSGILNLQTGGTTAISINATQVVSFTNTPLIGGADVVTTTGTQTLTNKTIPTVTGGSTASSTLTLRSTSGAGTSDAIIFQTASQVEVGRFTSPGFFEAVFSDEVVALGNTGTASTINLRLGNVFTATLTGNCTFTLSNPNANSSRGSSFTLILTNDGTAGRTVAWSGGSFVFPGGASTLSRTTTANATDVWVFFTPNNGTTWYGNISMKDVKA